MVGAGKGDADTRSPDHEARHRAYDRIFNRLYTREDLLEFVRQYYERGQEQPESFSLPGDTLGARAIHLTKDCLLLPLGGTACPPEVALDQLEKQLQQPGLEGLWKRQKQTKG